MKERFVSAFCCLVILLLSACSHNDDSSDSGTTGLTFVSQWNEIALSAVSSGSARPTITTRQMFLLSAAMYDAWTAYDTVALPYRSSLALKRPESEHTTENKKRSTSQAAYTILCDQFPEYESDTHKFSGHMEELGYPVDSIADDQTPDGIGILAAQAVLDGFEFDGSNWQNDYADITCDIYPELYQPVNSPDPDDPNAVGGELFNLNCWTPLRVPTGTLTDENGNPIVDNDDPSTYTDQTFLTPHWGSVTPFALASGDQFRPQAAPPQCESSEPYTDALGNTSTNDSAWNSQFDQVLEFSANLTDYQKVIAEFWADGPRTESPPGHWNQLAHGVSERDQHTVDDDVKMYFALNGALFDAGIATWDSKRYYNFIRPVSAIASKYYDQIIMAWGGPDQGTQAILGQDWRPYQNPTFVTPPFPEFVSGHSTFSRAAAEILTLFTGSSQFYDGVTVTSQDVNFDGEPDMLGEYIARAGTNAFEYGPASDVTLQWLTFEDAAIEAGISRVYGGIHIQDANIFGRDMGEAIGSQAYAKAQSLWNGEDASSF